MPDVFRLPTRMDCSGIDLVHPLDRMPAGSFGYLFNVRVLQEGRLDGRPGYTDYLNAALGDLPNSIRRLNDTSGLYAPDGFIYIGGAGTNLYAGTQAGGYSAQVGGFSGDPLSLIPFRPDQSPTSYMYVWDRLKNIKMRGDKVTRDIGVAPPSYAPVIDFGVPASVPVSTGQDATGWSASGAAASPTLTDRTNGGAPTTVGVFYNEGTTGWCCINPAVSNPFWMGARMDVILDSGGPKEETVTVREIHNAIQSTTIAAIQYDTGASGLCSIVPTNNELGLERNSLIKLGGTEVVRVLEVVLSPDGSIYSIRCSTNATFAATDAIDGLLSWYCYTTLDHTNGESIATEYIKVTQAALGTGVLELTSNINASQANGRPIDPANDYLHISIFLANPTVVTSLKILLSLDMAVNFSFDNPGNSYIWTLTGAQLQGDGSSNGSWVEVVVPISAAARSGADFTRNLSTISGIALQLVTTDACDWGFDWWYLFGTYGPVIQPNAPIGYQYQTRFRDSSTGAHSVPGPLTRYSLDPLRESVIITPATTTQAGVDTSDVYRVGGTISSPLYVLSVENNNAAPFSATDTLPDDVVLAADQPPDLTSLQPWPILDTPWTGTCHVIGTGVIWDTGTEFNLRLIGGTIILINGKAYQTYGQPRTSHFLELTEDAGYLASANFQIASPTLAGSTLPFAFGALEGPFAPVIFGLGDPKNGGTLYFTNYSDADGASDQNSLELAAPGYDLVSGAVWKGVAFAGNRDELFCIRYSYLTTLGASGNTSYQWNKIDSPSGIWSRWACCSTPIGVAYLGRDGLYIATDSGSINITDEKLYPLFPHDGQAAESINSGSNIILPVDMTRYNYLRLSYCDEAIRFSYIDTGGNFNTLVFEIYKKRWFLNNYAGAITFHYLSEGSAVTPKDQEILMLDVAGSRVVKAGGNTDDGALINSIVLTSSNDGGDERAQKLYVDSMIMADQNGTISLAPAYDNAQTFGPVSQITPTGQIEQFLVNIDSLDDLSLYRNIGCKFAWTGGPDGPRLYAWEPSGYVQPYLTSRFVTQYIGLSFPGWKSHRRAYPSLISNDPVDFYIRTQDGRRYGPYTFPSTVGQYRTLPTMLDQNIKDLAFAYELDGRGKKFAFFPDEFTVETKEWTEETYIHLAIFKS